MSTTDLEDVWRQESAHVLGALLRRHGDLADCEDAAQEAAARQWPRDGRPDSPRGWLVRVASRRLVDQVRAEQARTAREQRQAVMPDVAAPSTDDPLELLLLCCHPALSRVSQVALTLRAVSGLSTAEVATAFLVPEATMAQRLSRARATLRSAGARFERPGPDELPDRVAAVLDVLHVVFTEGSTRSSGAALVDATLTAEAVRLTRRLRALLPDHDEVAGALALMLLTGARHAARADARGDLVPLAEQDRRRWDRVTIAEGLQILEEVLPHGHVGRYQLEAAIAAVHAEAATAAATDWAQVLLLYTDLERVAPAPAVTLNRAVAAGMALGPEHGLALLATVADAPALRRHHRLFAVRAHLRELAGDDQGALTDYREAARLTASRPEQRYLNARAARLVALGP
ncbi:Predicted RNA polymerase sigma factor, contains C-terminal TPR domain [Friedmanniella luteola]|uniref:Predicted RNA polymerase sigma factor, contains C-terminal TPR domain n=1 Tax=Friedmanniella luteola TaxID=546871 RepID=A0A1H1SHH2_9ACTN|nr:DUF6596 domain-containing protein [Friedmanniella luteola]SDS47427.1 Predicted RNA polymerase sigma factor, contains C-terminal TPR domain [Friedmanniella luteola]